MINQPRRDLLRLLGELSERFPEMRFGQLVANLSFLAKEPTTEAIWDAEDDELIAAATRLLKDAGNARPSVA